jgi:two-component system, OmpR family, response regulator RegX3
VHVLLVEDEASVAEPLAQALRREGFEPTVVSTVADALESAAQVDFGFVLLDLTLPDGDGRDVCRVLRRHSAVPIVMLTARGTEFDKIIGLELGADDYLTKPFSPRELVARVRAVLRRADPGPESNVLEVGEVRVDLRTRRATFAGSPLALRTLEFELLAELARNAGNVVTRDRLLERVWGISFAGGTRTVDVHVAQLRKKLGRPAVIHTVRGIGYRLLDSHT